MSRVYNFSAGPAALPLEVLETIRDDMPDWQGTGMSVMEVSHRGKDFVELAPRSGSDLRELLQVPDDYSVLFPQGGATLQMAMAPLNLAARRRHGRLRRDRQLGQESGRRSAESSAT